jgi:glycosyltransferase involved in cell wall biosynthesis
VGASTYPLDTWPARRIARLAGARYIHEAHDLWPLTLTELGGMSKRNPFVVLLQVAENSAYRHADLVVSLLPNTLDHMRSHGLSDAGKYTYIPNGIVNEWKSGNTPPDDLQGRV